MYSWPTGSATTHHCMSPTVPSREWNRPDALHLTSRVRWPSFSFRGCFFSFIFRAAELWSGDSSHGKHQVMSSRGPDGSSPALRVTSASQSHVWLENGRLLPKTKASRASQIVPSSPSPRPMEEVEEHRFSWSAWRQMSACPPSIYSPESAKAGPGGPG